MFDKFGEFDSVEELNKKAKELLDQESLQLEDLANENGIDTEDAKDYLDGFTDELATPLMAAIGKLKVEEKELKLEGIVAEWKEAIVAMCMEDEKMQRAVRKKGKSLCKCLAAVLKYSFENKVQVSSAVVRATKVQHNGKTEDLKGPLYMGMPTKAKLKEIIRTYYGVEA